MMQINEVLTSENQLEKIVFRYHIIIQTMCGPVAQWIEQLPSKQWVVGSIPPRTTIFFAKKW